ncbi:MAG: geranylgeranylglycerol-phosphate geranylgeranyltransferase [Flavobacteriales bacterium]|nr:geranylgeranylglycerol-phosphate geranylgeranyltransferase [Flavobacteriales bacterium]
MLDYLKLIRVKNLLIIGLTQYLIRYFVVLPLLASQGLFPFLSDFDFFILVLSMILVGSGGYIINDYFDTKVDRKNERLRNVVGKTIKRRVAMVLHVVVNSLGILLGAYVAYKVGVYWLVLVNIGYATLLWFYSTDFKHQPVIGNFVISLLTSCVPLVVIAFELPPIIRTNYELAVANWPVIGLVLFYTAGFALFAFLTNLIREIVKDMEDIKGDLFVGSKTLPIVFGIRNTKTVIVVLILTTMILLAYVQIIFSFNLLVFFYFVVLVQIPLVFITVKLLNNNSKKTYHLISEVMKFIMVIGIMFTIVLKNQMSVLEELLH